MRYRAVLLLRLGLLLALALVGARGLAQRPPAPAPLTFRTLTANEGLSENSVYSIVQDRRGFLWLGTQDGLSRYDGAGFKVYRNDPQRPRSLSSNFILSQALDGQGTLWVATGGGGLCRYNALTDDFQVFEHDPAQPTSLADNFVRVVFSDRQGRLWVGTDMGVQRMDARSPRNGRFTLFRHRPEPGASTRFNSIRAIAQDQAGRLWVGTGQGNLSYLDTGKGELVAQPGWKPRGPITTLCADKAGLLWVGTEAEGLFSLDQQGQISRYQPERGRAGSLSSNVILSITEDAQRRLWVGTNAGLNQLDRASGSFLVQQPQPLNPLSLPDKQVHSLYQDRDGMLWAGTEAGVSCFEAQPSAFRTLPVASRPGPVWAVCEDSTGRVWVGTETEGVVGISPRTGQRTVYRHDPNDPGSLPQNFIRGLCVDRRGRLWVGTQNSGVHCLNPATGSFTHYRHQAADPASLSDDMILFVSEDRSGQIWVGTGGGGLNLLDPTTGRCQVFRNDPGNPRSLNNNFVRVVHRDRKGSLWVGTGGGGLSRFDARTGRSKAFRANPDRARSLSSNFVRCILEDRTGTLWVGTEGGGFNRLDDADNGLFTTFREPQGLPNDVVYGMVEDRWGSLWLSTNRGIARFSPKTGTFRTYDMRDGLPQDEFNAGAYHQGQSGQLYFGGVSGVVAFRPEAVRSNTKAPPVVLTSFRKFNQPVRLDTSITERRVIKLGPQDNFFSIDFAALNFRLPDKNRYAYKLEGFDKNWIDGGARREAAYTNLDPGTYTFRVRAANNDGVWNQLGTTLRVIVEPPWWQTWWFRLLASWVVFAMLFMAYQMRVRQLLALERVRHGIARDLHDDMGSTLSSISILSQLAQNHQHQNRPEQAAALLHQIGESSRRMLDSMDDIVWTINPAHDSLDAVTARMRSFASDILEARGIDFTFRVAPEVQGLRLDMRARREFFLLFKEAVNNLAKYARCERASISLTYEQRQLVLVVADDGVGFDLNAPAQGGGNGLVNMHTRAAAMGGTLTITTAPGAGTTLRLSVTPD
ncbi:histidine kinase [Hymenobacter sp. BT175]|uniref:sensor histidine kinase n=1 Tax=Hymenobacter translucens TaxID=2886507 RepID=UPI001D0E2AA5|nr:two-component regulator propeller domain-containing protein [Hymenobacter translucens]MCC2547549.1 histidine kinase [Hymenobacter translucens]